MMASLVTTSPATTRSNGVDTLYKSPCSLCCTAVRLPLRGCHITKARPRMNGSQASVRRPATTERRKRMILHDVTVHPSKANLKREDQLAWKIAAVAADRVAVDREVAAMLVNRIIDNAAVAIAAINRRPVVSARDMALGHPRKDAATVFGVAANKRVSPEWAAWANGT